MYISKEKLTYDIKFLETLLSNTNTVIHSDILKVGLVKKYSVADNISIYLNFLSSIATSNNIFLPSFNYDFCKTGKYSQFESESQVGALSKAFGKLDGIYRTSSPVFNFYTPDKTKIEIPPPKSSNPFDESSIFSFFQNNSSQLLFLGAPLHTNTYIHRIEEIFKVPYRFIKEFKGIIKLSDNIEYEHTLKYRVRPLVENSCTYDWPKINAELIYNKIFKEIIVGNCTCYLANISNLTKFWSLKLSNDIYYFLTDESKMVSQKLPNK